jgi:hypothetical protein
MVDFLKSTLNESLNWITGNQPTDLNMDDSNGERESLWSSDDAKSHDTSITSVTNELEENYFACPIVRNIINKCNCLYAEQFFGMI